MGPLETRHTIRHPTTIHTGGPQSHNRDQALSVTVDTISQKDANTPVFVLNRAEWFKKGLLEEVGRSDSDWTDDSATRQSVTGFHCNVQGVTMRNRSLKQTAISLSSCQAEYYAANACTINRKSRTRRTFQGTALQRFSSSRNGFRSRHDTFYSAEDQADSSISKYDAWRYNS